MKAVTERSNRTGMSLKPSEAEKMIDGAMKYPPSSSGDGSALLQERAVYIKQGEPIGSMPLPKLSLASRAPAKTEKGIGAGTPPLIFMDKLGERLAFERSGTRLYESFLGKLSAQGAKPGMIAAAAVEEILADEHQHFLMLAQAIAELGGDPTAVTPAANVVGVQSLGLVQVLSDPRTTVDQSLCALLTAELTDNAGWQLLATLAQGLGHEDLAQGFFAALAAEERHLLTVRGWVESGTFAEAGLSK